jgi:hypothetical protein
MDLSSISLRMNLMRFLMQWFLVGALGAMARLRLRGLGTVTSLDNAGHVATGLAFLLH